MYETYTKQSKTWKPDQYSEFSAQTIHTIQKRENSKQKLLDLSQHSHDESTEKSES